MSVSLKQLSARLGLSPTTVSRALNGYPEVNEATRQRVKNMAEQLHYHPNARARSLATGRQHAIAHVISGSISHEIMNPVFSDFIAGAGEVYSAAGYDMILRIVPDTQESEVYRELVARGSVDGVMVHVPRQRDPRVQLLHELKIPFLFHGRTSDVDVPYSWLDINNQHSFEQATELLLDYGHTHIALLNGLEDMDFARRRRAGFMTAYRSAQLSPRPELMRQAAMTEPYGYHAALELMALPEPPTAFLTSSMMVAYGVRRALTELGLKLRQDISLITHDDELSYLPNEGEVPMFTATRSSVREAGRRSARLLLSLVDDPECGPVTELMETSLIMGASTGPMRRLPHAE